uniref:WAT1-related protein n=1 Tax=Caenorhabditis tropicalis TaxID=1561998 RepID=A0A1I7U7V0_9PELO
MPSVQWLRGESVTQSTCGYISILTNGLLMLLIHFKSPSKLGNYKWLMLYTSLFELIYAFLTLFAGPVRDQKKSFKTHRFSACSYIWFRIHCIPRYE